jgi:protein-disulfide isomerase
MKFARNKLIGFLVLGFVCFRDDVFSRDAVSMKAQGGFSTPMSTTETMPELEEIVIGDKDAPVTIVIYLSFSCKLCQQFCQNELPKFRSPLNNKEVKIYLRHFPDDPISRNAAVYVRCLGKTIEKVKKLYLLTFKHQDDLMKIKNQQDIEKFLNKILPNEKISAEKIAECKNNKKIYLGLTGSHFEANITLGISSTPAFIIVGKDGKDQIHQGFLTYENIMEKTVNNAGEHHR